jgi:hypothetical protein
MVTIRAFLTGAPPEARVLLTSSSNRGAPEGDGATVSDAGGPVEISANARQETVVCADSGCLQTFTLTFEAIGVPAGAPVDVHYSLSAQAKNTKCGLDDSAYLQLLAR